MSVELRVIVEGDCDCGVPKGPTEPWSRHQHHLECDWGRIDHPNPRPGRGEVGHLMLITPGFVQQLAAEGPIVRQNGVTRDSVSFVGGRTFVHREHDDQRWTWEVFEAHWQDGSPCRFLVGRWPD